MARTLYANRIVLGLAGLACLVCSPLLANQEDVFSYLPNESQLEGWEALGDPQTAEGNDLFLLINGGAEIYHEYGFERAVMHSYQKGDKSVNLEVYEMEDAASAYGAYSFKTGRGGDPLNIGDEAKFEEYYLNFWKGNVVVTIVGFDTDAETREAILTFARTVEAKIPASATRPSVMPLLPEVSNDGFPVHPTYVEGNLGLINRYRFGSGDVFGFSCAAVGDYGDHMLFLFPFETDAVASEHLARASQTMAAGPLYSDVTADDRTFSAVDRDGRTVSLSIAGEFLIAFVGDGRDNAAIVLEELAERIAERSGRRRHQQ